MSESQLIIDPFAPPAPTPTFDFGRIEAEAFGAYKAVLQRYQWAEWLRCEVCFEREGALFDGAGPSVVTNNRVYIKCRCGVREYNAPRGTDIAPHLSNSALVLGNVTTSTITKEDGAVARQRAVILEKNDAAIIRRYWKVVAHLRLRPFLCHRPCWNGLVNDESAMQAMVTGDQIAIMCSCSTFFYQGLTV